MKLGMPNMPLPKFRKKKRLVAINPVSKTVSGPGVSQQVGKAIGNAIGSAIGGGPGGSIGAMLGSGAGALFKKITGLGDYTVTSNSLMTPATQDALPTFTKHGRGTRVLHREYLQDIVTSSTIGAFSLNSYPIQPALIFAFPWLSNLAAQFDEYQLNGVIYEFKSNSYDALSSTNTASGTVVMTTQYNVLLPAFTNKQSMEQYEFTCSAKPSVNIMHPVECARGESPVTVLSTRTANPTTGDLRLYDFATFYIATVGMQGASTNIGELWVSYDITLLKPRLGPVGDVADHYNLGPLATIGTGGTGVGPYFGLQPILSSSSNLGSTLSGGNTINIPPIFTGVLQIQLYYRITVSALWAPYSFILTGGINFYNFFGNGPYEMSGAYSQQPMTNTTTSQYVMVQMFTCVGGGTIIITGGTNNVVLTDAELLVLAFPSSLIN